MRYFSESELMTALAMRDAGRTAREIGKALGRTRNSVLGGLYRLREAEEAAERGHVPQEELRALRLEETQRLVAQGKTVSEIADHYGVTRGSIYKYLRAHGLKPVRPSKKNTLKTEARNG